MKNQKGFIQIPILIAIIISAVIFGGGGYFIAHEISKSSKVGLKSSTTKDTDQQITSSGSEALKSLVDTKLKDADTKPAVAPTKTEKNWEFSVKVAAETAEKFKLLTKEIRNSEFNSYIKDRRNRIANNANLIKSMINFPNYDDGAILNQMLSDYAGLYKIEIEDIDKTLIYVESQVTQLDNYQAEYNKKVSSLLAMPEKAITNAEAVSLLQSSGQIWLKNYDIQKNILDAYGIYNRSIGKREDNYEYANTLISAAFSKIKGTTSASDNYYQPMPPSSPPLPFQMPKTINCNFFSGPTGGFAGGSVQCTEM